MKLKATCVWGMGPDIILNNKDRSIDCDLSLEEAKELVCGLQMAILQVEELNRICKDHDDAINSMEKKNESNSSL